MPLADYDELRKIDVRPFCKKRDGLDYVGGFCFICSGIKIISL